MRLSLRNKRVSFLVRLLILSPLAELSFVQSSSRECNQTDYYFQLLPRNRDLWTRDDLEDLLRSTHTDYAPFYSSEPGNGDVLRALMTLDSGSDNERIELFYSDVEAPQYPLDRSVWVPEHICPVFMSTVRPMDFDFAFSDLHNIRPVDPDIHESNRGTAYFGTCPTCNELVQQGSDTCICGDFFQPPETSRGIVARSWLYMQLRYPDLPISKCHLEQLLAWHESNPPTYDEKQRNKMICSKYQGNRNPYVDFPELALNIRMFETECEEAIDHGENNITGGNQSNQTNSGNSTVLPVFNPDDDTDGNADDSSEADNTEPGNTEADNTDLGNTEAYNTDLGNTEADNTELGNTEANNTEVENTEVDTEESVSGNIFDTDSRVEDTIEPVEDPCSTLLPGDIYF